jgi:hypothetical protein
MYYLLHLTSSANPYSYSDDVDYHIRASTILPTLDADILHFKKKLKDKHLYSLNISLFSRLSIDDQWNIEINDTFYNPLKEIDLINPKQND